MSVNECVRLTHSSVALCLLKPAVSSSMRDAHIGFHLARMLVGTKSDDRNMNMSARPSTIYLCLPDVCASWSMPFLLFYTM